MVVAPDKPTPGYPPPRQQVGQTDLQDGDIAAGRLSSQDKYHWPFKEVKEPPADEPVSEDKEYVTVIDLVRITGLSRSLLYAKANDGELPGCRRLGSRLLIHLPTFKDHLKSGNGQYDIPKKDRKPQRSPVPRVVQKVEAVVEEVVEVVEEQKTPLSTFWKIFASKLARERIARQAYTKYLKGE